MKSRWETFESSIRERSIVKKCPGDIKDLFPFTGYFSNAPQPIFTGQSYEQDLETAEGCYRHIQKIFDQLEEFRYIGHVYNHNDNDGGGL